MQRTKNQKTFTLTVTALLMALQIVMTFTGIGYIPVGPLKLTLLTLPVAIGAVVCGPYTGFVLGATFGLTSFATAVLGMDALGALLLSFGWKYALFLAIVCIVPRILCGWLPALLTVKDIVDKADEVLADTSKDALCADLRFGHDYPFIAMCSAMGLEGIGQNLATEEVNLKWFGPWMTPFAANLQMIFYKNKKGGDVLVKFLVNERETALMGVEPVSGPYYRWSDVRKKFTTLRY